MSSNLRGQGNSSQLVFRHCGRACNRTGRSPLRRAGLGFILIRNCIYFEGELQITRALGKTAALHSPLVQRFTL